jgi:hypothetical protein
MSAQSALEQAIAKMTNISALDKGKADRAVRRMGLETTEETAKVWLAMKAHNPAGHIKPADIHKYSKTEEDYYDRYLHVDMVWTKLYWRNKLSREDGKKANKKTNVFGKSYGDREMLLCDVTSLTTHKTLPHTLIFQCEKKKRSYVFEVGEDKFALLETALHLVLDFVNYSKNKK